MRTFMIVLVVSAVMLGCSTLPVTLRPDVRAVRPRITAIDFHGVNMAFDVDVRNPLPVVLSSPRLRYGIEIQGSDFVSSEMAASADLPARGVGTVSFPVRLSYYDLWRTYKNLGDASEVPYRLHVAIVCAALGQSFEIPVSHAGAVPILRPPVLTALRVRLADVSLSKATIIVDSEVKNPNVFSLGIGNLRYRLDLGDVRIGDLSASSAGSVRAGQTQQFNLSGEVSASNGLIKLLMSGVSGKPEITASGLVQTPYGPVRLPK
jgi:LEA14-like dessication related protein